MAVKVVMPKLGMAMKKGEVSVWNKKVGDPVEKGESIASINSEKIEMEIEAPESGTLLHIKVKEGEGVPPGTPICYIGENGEEVLEKEAPAPENAGKPQSEPEHIPAPKAVQKRKHRVKISPVARKMAEKAGLKVETLNGTGPGGRIVKADVIKAMKTEAEPQSSVQTAQPEEKPASAMRKVIADRMHKSLQNSAQLTLTMKADITELVKWQEQLADSAKKRSGVKLTVTHFVSRAAVLALKQHPELNSSYQEERIITYPYVHLGMAVSLENGLVVPVIRDAEKLSFLELADHISTSARRAREGNASGDDLHGSTFSITNLGGYGIEHFTPILNPPEAGILGVGASYETPAFKGDELVKSTMLPLSLTFDHRVCDGSPAADFLKTVKALLEEPAGLIL
ncbi:2-oxo acid dehydrogenase subunit E2 [Bacillus velezensis]|uniref:Dihydrolipoamide acetyltransferase component of pyruvate dehydrogenase complex n=1 Tax=Bacillus velezensis (strain DSM 23117 / BGSC 10A6 / LMG 26770 / FZB42) TaxID=326423 RepID=A7Z2J0_BACVZ|nr:MULTISPECIES: dihydrolipoamide acetyltransferase family protein [Bacillus amyloliquefaciens group]ABS73216.1 2-oxo acid dehydrogenase subunit E2 [Bacillus velezensis FZB42]AGZ55524.1 branched-chain alpha-keto acid dehydrogenase subunit E2 [Bacillus amyloliquefaciens CC178]MBG9700082.1 branched-chain alpha-keto acid dehydrogenase subunit E2 [Bacillus amyloliquefaciens]MBT9268829.1 2-oxo acid dehydrogenase subunit E2 [Bacillus velezensis]MCF7601721.1 2-oxo acid dehydrogenase subunit E2 [Bacil